MPDEVKKMFQKEFKQNDIWKHFKAVKTDQVYDLEEVPFGITANVDADDAMTQLYNLFYKSDGEIMLQHYSKLLFLISIILLCVTVYVSFIVGTIPISLKDILTQFTTGHVSNVDTIIDLRLPRIIIALCVGAMLSVSGALLQAVLQNPLADAQLLVFHQEHLSCV